MHPLHALTLLPTGWIVMSNAIQRNLRFQQHRQPFPRAGRPWRRPAQVAGTWPTEFYVRPPLTLAPGTWARSVGSMRLFAAFER